MDTCRTCGSRIRWIITPNGSKHPIDYDPIRLWQYNQETDSWGYINMGHRSHFKTCPDAEQHSKKNHPNDRKEHAQGKLF